MKLSRTAQAGEHYIDIVNVWNNHLLKNNGQMSDIFPNKIEHIGYPRTTLKIIYLNLLQESALNTVHYLDTC